MYGKEVRRNVLGHRETELQIFEENYIKRCLMIFYLNL
jgi:hypothetical protein